MELTELLTKLIRLYKELRELKNDQIIEREIIMNSIEETKKSIAELKKK